MGVGTRGSAKRFCSTRCRVAHHRWHQLPALMRERSTWVRTDRKRPIQVDGSPASSTDPSSWTTYERVADGPHGIMLGDGLACWDLDDCFDEDDRMAEWARQLIDGVHPVWVERSMSGSGLHVFVEGPEEPGTRRGQIEYYSRHRLIVVTEDRWPEKP